MQLSDPGREDWILWILKALTEPNNSVRPTGLSIVVPICCLVELLSRSVACSLYCLFSPYALSTVCRAEVNKQMTYLEII